MSSCERVRRFLPAIFSVRQPLKTSPELVTFQLGEPNSETPTPASPPTKSGHLCRARPTPPGDRLDFPDTPQTGRPSSGWVPRGIHPTIACSRGSPTKPALSSTQPGSVLSTLAPTSPTLCPMHPAQLFGPRMPQPSTMCGSTKVTDPPASFGIGWVRRWPRTSGCLRKPIPGFSFQSAAICRDTSAIFPSTITRRQKRGSSIFPPLMPSQLSLPRAKPASSTKWSTIPPSKAARR